MSTRSLLIRALAGAALCSAALAPGLLPSPATGPATDSSTGPARPGQAGPPEAARLARYEVSITNLTRGQIFSPPVVATHSPHLDPLWTLGQPASAELAGVAEDALNQPLVNLLAAQREVRDVQVVTGANGPILPGETAVGVLQARFGGFDRLSMAGMLVITNDAFFGLNGVELPRHGDAEFLAVAYDAGSEANTEMCAHIPGPPCNNPMVRVTTGAEGYVHVHAGVHGIGDLSDATHDWRNPVALIRVRRVW